jgi:hypothetical protein|nr:MAG TPA: hypothetical protein [Bacteriophage sp.]
MIKLNTFYSVYSTKEAPYIVIIRNPKTKLCELYLSAFLWRIEGFSYRLSECIPLLAFRSLSEARCYARKIIDGENF